MVPDREAEPSDRQAAARAALTAALAAAGDSATPAAGAAPAAAVHPGPHADPTDATDPVDPVERARELCLRLLAGRPRTRAELADAMRRRGVPDEAAAAVLARIGEPGQIGRASGRERV